jgi:phthalate 4,5-dioxygenase oxygenase subunit
VLTAEENDLLCRVEGEAPMGRIMRRHWLPACLAEDVAAPDGTPVRTRLLGEDLIVFRDSQGRLGVIGEHCPHRRASLALGRNEDCGLRCLYHGWKVDVEGNVLEMPSEPVASALKQKVKHTAYPAHEAGGMIWTYLGPPDTRPAFERPAFAPTEDASVSIAKIVIDCNWAQILEGAIDSAHSSSLHSSDMVPARVERAGVTESKWLRPSTDKAPRLEVQPTSFGFRYAALRRPIKQADTHDYVRLTVFVAPFTVLIPPNASYNVANVNVPIDDTHTAFHFIAWGGGETPHPELWRKFNGAQVGVDVDHEYRKIRTRANHYLQDRQAMRLGDWTGIRGIPNQDIAMWETMGPLADRTRERLGASDLAVVEFRKRMVEAARTMQRDGVAIGCREPRVPQAELRSVEGVFSKTIDWRTLGVSELERRQTADGVADRRDAPHERSASEP